MWDSNKLPQPTAGQMHNMHTHTYTFYTILTLILRLSSKIQILLCHKKVVLWGPQVFATRKCKSLSLSLSLYCQSSVAFNLNE